MKNTSNIFLKFNNSYSELQEYTVKHQPCKQEESLLFQPHDNFSSQLRCWLPVWFWLRGRVQIKILWIRSYQIDGFDLHLLQNFFSIGSCDNVHLITYTTYLSHLVDLIDVEFSCHTHTHAHLGDSSTHSVGHRRVWRPHHTTYSSQLLLSVFFRQKNRTTALLQWKLSEKEEQLPLLLDLDREVVGTYHKNNANVSFFGFHLVNTSFYSLFYFF